jgi:anti-anti-sigma factor
MRSGSAEGFTVRVLKAGSDQTAGIGFLVTERHIVTCAHVVNAALGRDLRKQSKPGGNVRVQVEFPKLGGADGAPSRICRVQAWVPPPPSGVSDGDIAGLVLAKGDLPDKAGPARLLDEAIPRGSAVDVFGYPGNPPRPENGANSRLIARGAVGNGLVQLDADGETAIRTQAGFSGSPVVVADEVGDAVTGMLVMASRDGSGGDAYAVPVAALADGWPDVIGALTLPPCPYKGLSPFSAEDAERSLYVGREEDIAELQRLLKRRGLVIVAGSSGVGKSSLLAAGLGHFLAIDGWTVASVRPGAAPMEALARALVEVDRSLVGADLTAIDDRLKRLRAEGLVSTGARLTASIGRPILLCVDPLEDVLDSGCEENARAEFLQQIFSLRPMKGHDFRVVCALRADFISHLLDHRDTPRNLKQMIHMLFPLAKDQLERIIREPALARGVEYESTLVSQIAEDADGGSGLPLLEWALFDMWRHLRGRTITLADYRRIGGVSGALARHAEKAYERLTERLEFDRNQIRNVFLTLVRTGASTTRRTVPYADLTPGQLAVASVLIKERLLACHTDDLHGEVLEIAHEALLSQWDTLAGWIGDDRRFLDWHTKARDNVSGLLQECEVAQAREWLATRRGDIDSSVQEMIERSHTYHEEQMHRLEDALGKAEDAARMSEALRLASLSEHVGETRGASSSAAIALAIESLLKVPTVQGDLALRKSLARAAETVTLISGNSVINEVAYSKDGTLIAAARADGYLSIFTDNGEASWERRNFGAANSVSFSPDGKWVACGYSNGVVLVLSSNHGDERCRLAHEDAVKIVEFSPDGRIIATACDDGTARLYDAALGEELHQFGHTGSVNAIAFSADGDVLATACDDGTARLYEVATGSLRHSIVHPGPVTAVALSPNEGLLVTACDDGTARIYEADTGAEKRNISNRDPVKAVAFSHDGSFIAITGGRPKAGVMRVIDAASGNELAVQKDKTLLTSVTFSHDDSLVATASRGGLVRLFNLPDGSEYSTISHEGPVTSVSFSPDRIRIVTAGMDGKALISGRVTGDERLRVPHNRRVTSVAFSPDKRLLATSSAGGRVVLSDWTTGTVIREISRENTTVNSVCISPDTKWLATADTHGFAVLYEASADTPSAGISHDGPVRAIAFSPDSRWLGTGSSDWTARIIRVTAPVDRRTLSHPGPVNAVAFSRNCQWIATACGGPGSTGLARVFEVSSGSQVRELPHEGWVNWVAFSPDGKWLATASDDGTARIFNLEIGDEYCRISHDRRVSHVAFSPDGQWVATASDDRTARIFNPESGEEHRLLDHDSWVNWVAFSPDGGWLATAGNDGTARIFNPATGIERNQLVHREAINMVAFSPDSQWVATASDDGTARVSPIAMDILLDTARERMTRPLSLEESRQFGLAEPARTRRSLTESPWDHSDSQPASKSRFQRRLTLRDHDWYRVADWTVVNIEGEVDVYTAPRLRELLIDLVNRNHYHIILDLDRVEFLDSTGMGVFTGGLKRVRAHGGAMSIVCSQERIRKIFRITGQNRVFEIFDTVNEAKASSTAVVPL